MVTMAQKLTANSELVAVRQGGRQRKFCDPELADALNRASSLWKRFAALDAELAEAKAYISGRAERLAAGGSTVSFETDETTCTVSFRHEAVVPEENVRGLRELLGRRFRDLVRTKVRHTATSKLIEEAESDVLSLIRLRRLRPQFKWGEK